MIPSPARSKVSTITSGSKVTVSSTDTSYSSALEVQPISNSNSKEHSEGEESEAGVNVGGAKDGLGNQEQISANENEDGGESSVSGGSSDKGVEMVCSL